MSNTIALNEEQIVSKLKAWINEADADELARITGEVFGGTCFTDGETYDFTPDDENYYGAFDDVA